MRTTTSARTERTNSDYDDDDEENDELKRIMKQKTSVIKQRYYDIVDPKEINKIVQKLIMSLIWGFGAPLTSPARPNYSLFLHDLIKKVFAPGPA